MLVEGQTGNTSDSGLEYPRTIKVRGLPWDKVMGGAIELHPNPLEHALSAETLRDGFREDFESEPGFAPMHYKDGWIKRCIVDKSDRYTAVIRMKDNTFVYAKPLIVAAPRPDLATVVDLIISPETKKDGDKEFLADRGPLRRDMELPKKGAEERPEISSDGAGKPYFLRFNGLKTQLSTGALSTPPGDATLELWIRPRKTGSVQTVYDSWGSTLSLGIDGNGKLNLLRVNQARQAVWLHGKTVLSADVWHHVVAVYTGIELRLYVDGKPDASPVECHGARTDEKSVIGAGTGMLKALEGRHESDNGSLNADIALFRLLQRAMTDEEVEKRYKASSTRFER